MRAHDHSSSHEGHRLEHLWARQEKRLALAASWWWLVGGRPGAHVADVGCGPGRLALEYASWAGPAGSVLAVDVDQASLDFLLARRDPERHAPLRALRLDVQDEPLPAERYDAVLLTDALHHIERPLDALRHLRATRSTLLVGEFDPAGPGDVGPPTADRIAPDALAAWLVEAGWAPEPPAFHPEHEQYSIIARSR